MADIFINHRKRAHYKLILKLRYDRIITLFKIFIKPSDLTKIKSFIANNILQSLQYDFNHYAVVCLLKFYLEHNIKKKQLTSYTKSLSLWYKVIMI